MSFIFIFILALCERGELTNAPPASSPKATRQVLWGKQNTTVTPVIHFAMIRDFVIRNYTEIYILQHYSSVYTRYFSMFCAIKIKRKGCAKLFLFFPFAQMPQHTKKIVSPPPRSTPNEKKMGEDMQLMWWRWFFGTHNLRERRKKNCKNVRNHFSCVKHFAFLLCNFCSAFYITE